MKHSFQGSYFGAEAEEPLGPRNFRGVFYAASKVLSLLPCCWYVLLIHISICTTRVSKKCLLGVCPQFLACIASKAFRTP